MSVYTRLLALALATAPAILAACNADSGRGGNNACTSGTRRCQVTVLERCEGGVWQKEATCTSACEPGLGCVDCLPNHNFCDGDDVRACDPTGKPGAVVTTCNAGWCSAGTCNDPCGTVAAEFSYIGCNYWPTVTVNTPLVDPLSGAIQAHFAIAVANTASAPTEVQITRGTGYMATEPIPAKSLRIIRLPWVNELLNPVANLFSPIASAQVKLGAYKLSATLPVTVYQFNPVEFKVEGCTAGKSCFTYSNDASLLLPSHALTGNYVVIARSAFLARQSDGDKDSYIGRSPGFFAITAVEPGTTQVSIKFAAATMASQDGKISAFAAGSSGSFTLAQQDVLQIVSTVPSTCQPSRFEQGSGGMSFGYCDPKETDLTGTVIQANHPVSVIAGHNCTFVPYDRWACDHLEESMLPVESWGKRYLATHTERTPSTIPDLWRIVSGANGNQITFTPNSVHAPVTLDEGKWIEIASDQDFEVKGTGAFALAQFMVGQDWAGYLQGGEQPGDPAMALAVPVEQYRRSYVFPAPPSYDFNYVNITAPAGATVLLDGNALSASQFTKFGGGDYTVARVKLTPGSHRLDASAPVGIASYGLAQYTSYMFVGGTDVRPINNPQ